MPDLANINLNYLLALDALLEERHVTRASQKLHITQAAMSNILSQLRETFDDQLLLRNSKGMIPTPRALEIQPQIRQILEQIEGVVHQRQAFDPATSERNFVLGISGQCASVILPSLSERFHQSAPRARLCLKSHAEFNDATLFEAGGVDFGIGLLFDRSPQLRSQLLFNEQVVCAARADHPLIQAPMTFDEYLAAEHVAIKCQTDCSLSYTDTALQALGVERKKVFTVNDILPALTILERSSLIGTFPARATAVLGEKFNLATQPVPFEVQDIPMMLIWHKQKDNDLGVQWLRELILSCVDN